MNALTANLFLQMRRGQVALYLLTALVALTLLVVMNARIFLAVRSRNRVENAGDAAALAAARAQGEALNAMGRLNLEHIVAAAAGDAARCEELVLRARRESLLGPVRAIRAASEAAKLNGLSENPDFTACVREHAETVRTLYAHQLDADGEPYPEPYPGAWEEYAAALEESAADGLAAGPDNTEYFGALGGHVLLDPNFYYAVAGETWCWFNSHAKGLLESYRDYRSWPPLPKAKRDGFNGSEFFPLHLKPWKGALTNLISRAEIFELAEEFLGRRPEPPPLFVEDLLGDEEQVWFLFDEELWRHWVEISPKAEEDHFPFPVVAEAKEEYDVRGAAVVTRCAADGFSWSAAAKPFGCLRTRDGGAEVVTARARLALPVFDAVRLVPLDAVGGGGLGSADYAWANHVRRHLYHYVDGGPDMRNCFYCQQLLRWENELFRLKGINWLKFHAGDCNRPVRGGGGGGGRGGGTAHGH